MQRRSAGNTDVTASSRHQGVRLKPLAQGVALTLAWLAAPALAQQTTSALSGLVVDSTGSPVTGADVIISHGPSGTMSRASTDENGRYNARGLRVGGPYTILVLKEGFQSKSSENVVLKLAQTSTVSVFLEPMTPELEAVEVVGAVQSDVFSPNRMGAGTNLNNEALAALPSISRSIQDYARLDPRLSQTDKQFGAISAAGQNNRYNQITIDGVTVNDTFGLQANNLPLLRQPVSMEAIEELSVAISNYDVIQRGYTGASINAVTKSGTNDFDGSVYYLFRDGDWGREVDDRGVRFKPFDEQETYGGTFGGPLIKDKLFFFTAYEKFKRTSPAPDIGSLTGVSAAQGQEAIDIARQVYNIDAGTMGASSIANEVEEYLVKFDWNINDYHRANLRYTKTEQNQIDLNRLGGNRLALSSSWFNRLNSFESYVGQVFSDWSDSFATELKISYREFVAVPQIFSRLPQFQISTGAGQIALGTEQFRHANLLTTDTWNGYLAGNWYIGDHDIKFGVDYENNKIYNLFLESSLGNYGFASLADFRAGRYNSYLLRLPANGGLDSAAADWTLNNVGYFLQDTWAFNPQLTLTYGFRVDVPDVPEKPLYNPSAEAAFGRRNDTTIDGNLLWQPRLGFNYTFDAERPTQLRGGIGLFSGAAANVWLSNPFTNNGRSITVFGCGGSLPACSGNLPPVSVDPDNQPRLAAGATPPADVDFVDADVKQPAVWKANLAFEHQLPWWGLVASAELMLLSTKENLHYDHLNLGAPTRVAPDGRNLYWNAAGYVPANWNAVGAPVAGRGVSARANRNTAFREVLLARSTNKGDAQVLTLMLQKPQSADSPWFWQAGYTFTDAHDDNTLAGAISVENWSSRVAFNPNEEVSARSYNTVRDRFTGVVTYKHFFFDGYKTEVGLFYEGRRGRPFSYVFRNDANGDGVRGNDLLYIPRGPGDVLFGSAEEEARFWAYVNSNAYLSAHLGQVAGRNDAYGSWVNSFDLRISQELPGLFGDNRAEIWLDVLNVGNLINKEWGHIDEVFVPGFGTPQGIGVVDYGGIDPATGRYVYRFSTPGSEVRRDNVGESRWALQIGFRYRF